MAYRPAHFVCAFTNDSADLLVLSSLATDSKPYATAEPRGSGKASIDRWALHDRPLRLALLG
jgi:hypothetical protein